MKKIILLVSYSALVGLSSASSNVDCLKLTDAAKNLISSDQSNLLEVVSSQVAAAPSCACEIVKAAIEITRPDVATVAAIVDAAITTSPENMRLISQCAIAAAPDAVVAVQTVLAKYEPNSGEAAYSAKGEQAAAGAGTPDGEVAALPNPLDFPGRGPVRPLFPILPPVIINSPKVSQVNPGIPTLTAPTPTLSQTAQTSPIE